MKPIRLLIFSCSISLIPFHTVSARLKFKVNCPNQFTATITKLETKASPTPSSYLEKITVFAKVTKVEKGDYSKNKKFKILKHGPVKLKAGNQYKLSMKDGYLCSATEVI